MADDQQPSVPGGPEAVRPEELRAILSFYPLFANLSDAAVEGAAFAGAISISPGV